MTLRNLTGLALAGLMIASPIAASATTAKAPAAKAASCKGLHGAKYKECRTAMKASVTKAK